MTVRNNRYRYPRQRKVPKRLMAVRDKIIGAYARGQGLSAMNLAVQHGADPNDIRQLLREAGVWSPRTVTEVRADDRRKQYAESVEKKCLCCEKKFLARHKLLYVCDPCKATESYRIPDEYTLIIA
jgi:hypothetical protein